MRLPTGSQFVSKRRIGIGPFVFSAELLYAFDISNACADTLTEFHDVELNIPLNHSRMGLL